MLTNSAALHKWNKFKYFTLTSGVYNISKLIFTIPCTIALRWLLAITFKLISPNAIVPQSLFRK
ncbi:MAG: hypothetical protein ACTS6G_00070 [Candidatus Hodgkinia cicadicola]